MFECRKRQEMQWTIGNDSQHVKLGYFGFDGLNKPAVEFLQFLINGLQMLYQLAISRNECQEFLVAYCNLFENGAFLRNEPEVDMVLSEEV